MLLVAIAIAVMAAVITIAKEFIDKSKWSHQRKLAWSAFVAGHRCRRCNFRCSACPFRRTERESTGRGRGRGSPSAFHGGTARPSKGSSLTRAGTPMTIEIHSISGDPESAAFGSISRTRFTTQGGQRITRTWRSWARLMAFKLGLKGSTPRVTLQVWWTFQTVTKQSAAAVLRSHAL